MKARKLNKRNSFLYAELIKAGRKDAIGAVVRFARKECDPEREYVLGNLVKSGMKDIPASENMLTFSNPLKNKTDWKILPNFIKNESI